MTTVVKETQAQRVERIKRERPSWSILDDILRYAQQGFASIPDEDLSVRMRAWGLYTQGDGGGVRGDAVPYFMMRLRTPNGALTAPMASTIATLSERYARGSLDITNRQNFQLHWLRIEDIPSVWEALESVGWTSQGSCGDNTRTVTGCPMAGIDQAEMVDASPLAVAVDRHMNGNPVFANLPRKFKITITGCAHWCTYPEINDIGLTAARRGDEIGFSLRVAGGLSTRPHLARRLNAFVPWGIVPDVVEAVTAVFRDSEELRVNRAKARMKFLFLGHGWTEDRFLSAIEDRLGYRLDPAVDEPIPAGEFRDHVGVTPQKQDGLFSAGFSVAAGRITPSQLRAIAELAAAYGDGTLRTTVMQNVVVLGIPEHNLVPFYRSAERTGIPLTGSPFRRGTISCTGSEYCKLAVVETKRFALDLISDLERRVPDFGAQIKLHVTGCPNACGQHWIADLGLQGVRVQDDGVEVDGFDIFIGGGLGAAATIARRLGVRVAATRASEALERLFRFYMEERVDEEETFRSWVVRVGDGAVKAALQQDALQQDALQQEVEAKS